MADAALADPYMDAIKGFEGYTPKASWDYAQYSNGYGTKAAHPGEVIDKDTAEQRFQSEIGKAADAVDKAYPQLPEGARAALTSLTYNAGPGWINGGLGNAVKQGDWGTARNLFLQYNRAGGQVSPGLANRRAQEAAWLTGAQQPQAGGPEAPQVAAGAPGGILGQSGAQAQAAPSSSGLLGSGMPSLGGGAAQMPAQPQFAQLPQLPGLQQQLPPLSPLQMLQRQPIDYSGLQRLLAGRQQGSA